MGQYQTFVVRFWADATEHSVRGHIQHIASRRGIYFRDTGKMLEFVRAYLEGGALLAISEEDIGGEDAVDGDSPEMQPTSSEGGAGGDR